MNEGERETRLRAEWDECPGHRWELGGVVIATSPAQPTWFCRCGAATHNPDKGTYCFIRHFGQEDRP